jgi:hypothetical protein
MIRITDQYFWNFVFTGFFAALVVMGAIILETESYRPLSEFEVFDFVLLSLATFRLIRLFVYDAITKFFREQFYDANKIGKNVVLEKPAKGPRRTIADLLSCPWCFGVWAAAMLTFFYALTPYAYFVILFLAIGAVATFLQLLANMIGWRAEQLKNEVHK